MKSLIKVLVRESLLSEKLAMVDADVDMIYDRYFREDIEELNRTGMLTDDMFKTQMLDTSFLTTPEAVEANKRNFCVIMINDNNDKTSYYNPTEHKMNVRISFNALNHLKNSNYSLKYANSRIHWVNAFLAEFSEERVKGTIHHELAHWIDDTMHNNHISKTLRKASEVGKKIIFDKSKIEIEAQMHNIKQLYNKYKDRWDYMDFEDMLKLSPILLNLSMSFKGKDKTDWVREIKTRMNREGLLGKIMR